MNRCINGRIEGMVDLSGVTKAVVCAILSVGWCISW